MRLGRLPHDPAELTRAPSLMTHTFGVIAPPQACDRSTVPFTPGLYQNDTIPDCTAAGLANAASAAAALAGFVLAIDPVRIPAFYAACVGCDATEAVMAATDGAVVLDVLARAVTAGVDIGEQVSLVPMFGTVDPRNRAALATGVAVLGSGYWGVTLRERDMETVAVRLGVCEELGVCVCVVDGLHAVLTARR